MQKQIEENSQSNSMNTESPTGSVVQRMLAIIAVLIFLFFVLLAGIRWTYSVNLEDWQNTFLASHGPE